MDPTTANISFLQEAIGAAAAISAADRLGVLGRLAAGPVDVATLARDCAIGERGARAVLAALAGLGLVEPDAQGWYRPATPHLARLPGLLAPWRGLETSIRADQPVVAADLPAGAEATYPAVVPILAGMFRPAATQAAELLTAPGLRILDVGAGAAPWSLALAARDPACHVTAADLPAVLAITRQVVGEAGYAAQFDYRSGDVFALDWPRSAYDLVLVGNLCHLFSEETNCGLLARLLPAIRPGARLAIIEVLCNETRDGPRLVVLYALGLLLRTRAGQVYPFSSYATWLRGAGYEAVEKVGLPASQLCSLITARRPQQ